MNMVIPDEGKLLWLKWALISDGSDFEDFAVMLFQNNETVDDDSTLTDFDICDFTGYADYPLTRASFGAPAITAHVAISTRSTAPTFTSADVTPQDVYGWILVGDDSGKVLAGQNFDTPRVMSNGDVESLDPCAFKFKTFA